MLTILFFHILRTIPGSDIITAYWSEVVLLSYHIQDCGVNKWDLQNSGVTTEELWLANNSLLSSSDNFTVISFAH